MGPCYCPMKVIIRLVELLTQTEVFALHKIFIGEVNIFSHTFRRIFDIFSVEKYRKCPTYRDPPLLSLLPPLYNLHYIKRLINTPLLNIDCLNEVVTRSNLVH